MTENHYNVKYEKKHVTHNRGKDDLVFIVKVVFNVEFLSSLLRSTVLLRFSSF